MHHASLESVFSWQPKANDVGPGLFGTLAAGNFLKFIFNLSILYPQSEKGAVGRKTT